MYMEKKRVQTDFLFEHFHPATCQSSYPSARLLSEVSLHVDLETSLYRSIQGLAFDFTSLKHWRLTLITTPFSCRVLHNVKRRWPATGEQFPGSRPVIRHDYSIRNRRQNLFDCCDSGYAAPADYRIQWRLLCPPRHVHSFCSDGAHPAYADTSTVDADHGGDIVPSVWGAHDGGGEADESREREDSRGDEGG